MVPVMRKPATAAASGMRSPSSQEAWCGSPHAICTTSVPRPSMSRFSSGTLPTCKDQLHTPMARGSVGTGFSWPLAARLFRRFNRHAQRPEVDAAGAGFVEGGDLLGLQLGDLHRPGPDDGPAGAVRLLGEQERLLLAAAEGLAQHLDDELERVVV